MALGDPMVSKHVDMDEHKSDEQEAQNLLIDHHKFVENEGTVSLSVRDACWAKHWSSQPSTLTEQYNKPLNCWH